MRGNPRYNHPMAKNKVKTFFLCRNCGSMHAKWMGKCPDCGTWDSLEETTKATEDPHRPRGLTGGRGGGREGRLRRGGLRGGGGAGGGGGGAQEGGAEKAPPPARGYAELGAE